MDSPNMSLVHVIMSTIFLSLQMSVILAKRKTDNYNWFSGQPVLHQFVELATQPKTTEETMQITAQMLSHCACFTSGRWQLGMLNGP